VFKRKISSLVTQKLITFCCVTVLNLRYNRSIFKANYPRELIAKPCNVHSECKLFEHAGDIEMIDTDNYKIVSQKNNSLVI
jgi:hypothetical protein